MPAHVCLYITNLSEALVLAEDESLEAVEGGNLTFDEEGQLLEYSRVAAAQEGRCVVLPRRLSHSSFLQTLLEPVRGGAAVFVPSQIGVALAWLRLVWNFARRDGRMNSTALCNGDCVSWAWY